MRTCIFVISITFSSTSMIFWDLANHLNSYLHICNIDAGGCIGNMLSNVYGMVTVNMVVWNGHSEYGRGHRRVYTVGTFLVWFCPFADSVVLRLKFPIQCVLIMCHGCRYIGRSVAPPHVSWEQGCYATTAHPRHDVSSLCRFGCARNKQNLGSVQALGRKNGRQ